MRFITIAIVCTLLASACKKADPYVCKCGIGTNTEETHYLDANFNPDERDAACDNFQTVDSNDNVITACQIVE